MFSSLLWQLTVYDVKQSSWRRCTQPEETSANIGRMYQNRACCLQWHTLQQLLWYVRITHTHARKIVCSALLQHHLVNLINLLWSCEMKQLSAGCTCSTIRSHWKFLLGTYKDLFGDLHVKVPWETTELGSIKLTYTFIYSIVCGRPTQNPNILQTSGSYMALLLIPT